MPFTTSSQETEWALFLQPQSPHGADFLWSEWNRINNTIKFELEQAATNSRHE